MPGLGGALTDRRYGTGNPASVEEMLAWENAQRAAAQGQNSPMAMALYQALMQRGLSPQLTALNTNPSPGLTPQTSFHIGLGDYNYGLPMSGSPYENPEDLATYVASEAARRTTGAFVPPTPPAAPAGPTVAPGPAAAAMNPFGNFAGRFAAPQVVQQPLPPPEPPPISVDPMELLRAGGTGFRRPQPVARTGRESGLGRALLSAGRRA